MSTAEIAPTVCLDGSALRRIREEKKLTQLYVAKVVGVTTDTVSRWENNRYPSVRKENALRLAEALEIPVQQILRECLPEELSPPSNRRPSYFFWAIVCVLALTSLALYIYWRNEVPLQTTTEIMATRLLAEHAAPGNIVPVRIWIETDKTNSKGFIVREHFPVGWKLVEAYPPASSLDNDAATARWLLKPGEDRILISYLLLVSAEAPIGQEAHFTGEVVVSANGHNLPAPLLGDEQMKIAPYQWADQNGDYRIDDSEMLQASDVVEEMKGVHLDWKLLEKIWDTGAYLWDEKNQRFLPGKPHPDLSLR
jgi:transcriptional regulator with XRE-family HTH domain